MFEPFLSRWALTPDGDPIVTRGARLLPVRHLGEAAMLKIALDHDEEVGGLVMAWWDGQGAARVLALEGNAILLERAEGTRSLSDYARDGRDDEATHILCDAIGRLHAPRAAPPPGLVPLPVWFNALEPASQAHGGILKQSAEVACLLLADPRDGVVLHGDIHHDNVLDFGKRGWLAIDPKRIHGERGFDYANLFCNPDVESPAHRVAVLPDRFASRLAIVCQQAGLDRRRRGRASRPPGTSRTARPQRSISRSRALRSQSWISDELPVNTTSPPEASASEGDLALTSREIRRRGQ